MTLELALLILQALLLVLLVRTASHGARTNMERVLNPAVLLALFYGLWMLVPQIFVLMPDHAVIGMEDTAPDVRAAAALPTQGLLLLFLMAVLAGYATALGLDRAAAGPLRPAPVESTHWLPALLAYAAGVAAFFLLGRTFHAMPDGTMRSALVKTTSGQVLMTLSFLGSFGVAYLCAHGWFTRRRLLAVMLFAIYAWTVLPIGARGRILWPAVIAILLVWGRDGQFRPLRVVTVAVAALAVLTLIDPLVIGLRSGDFTRLSEALSPSAMAQTLFYGRNFDGFANLLFITYHDRIPMDFGRLFTGSRDAYMQTYFPAIYEMGVAFPTTVPGEFWLAGRAPMLGALSLVYGFALGVFQLFLRHARRESQLWFYLLLAPWVTSVGGELAESLHKMMAACAPAVMWMAATWVSPFPLGARRVAAPGENA